ncbi:uncharacterized protein K02A2.6-like [Dermacentor silvarum]|uniref:uncharacterized protein K02A2.6-like n=1 Tax=Dermacentor silvarum TaxID=543639 RepID=UPI00189772BA|nr:uncharacterized protein K02A2.6-like [Dermacentor silvarum]
MWEFDAFLEDGDEDFASYVERFEHYCEVANVQEEKLKKSAFITAIGKNAYKTLKDLLLPATPAEKSLEDLVKVLSDHYEPASRIIAERFRFNRRYQAEVFLRSNAVQHVKTPPYHPASNGAAERLVQTVKKNLVRQLRDERCSGQARTIQHRLDQFLFTYCNTPCSTTGKTPAQSFLSWTPRTRLSILHPELAKR